MANVKAGRLTGVLPFATDLGENVVNVPVNVYAVGSTTPSTLYTDHIAGSAASNPVTTDAVGNFSFFAAPGDYDVVYQCGDLEVRQTVTVRDDPQNSAFSETATTVLNKLTFGTGVPTIAGIVGDVFIRTDDVGTHALYQCSVAGAASAATWVALVN